MMEKMRQTKKKLKRRMTVVRDFYVKVLWEIVLISNPSRYEKN
jgi:hypothetical protein